MVDFRCRQRVVLKSKVQFRAFLCFSLLISYMKSHYLKGSIVINDNNQTFRRTTLAGLLAIFSLCLGIMMPSPAQAAPPKFSEDDNFIPGASVDPNKVINVTITKYKQNDAGVSATGSVNDATKIPNGATPMGGVPFALYPITLENDCKATDLKVKTSKAGTEIPSEVECGSVTPNDSFARKDRTNAAGVIKWSFENFTDVRYFLLQETDTPAGVSVSQPVIVGLPFYTSDESGRVGYLYNVSLFPKNIATGQINKSVQGPAVTQVGNVLKYTITQNIYDASKGILPEGKPSAVRGDGYLDMSEIASSSDSGMQPQLRIVDRIPSNLKQQGDPIVSWSCGGEKTVLVKDTDYTAIVHDEDPGRIQANVSGGSSEPMFQDGNTGDSVKYLTVDMWKDNARAEAFKSATSGCTAQVRINVEIKVEVTADGDGTASSQGTIQNVANVDIYDGQAGMANPDGPGKSKILSYGFNFAKTDNTSVKPLPGAEFRLNNPNDRTKFLCASGEFSSDCSGSSFVKATSNSKGIVTFAALPMFKQDDYRTNEDGVSVLKPGVALPDAAWLSVDNGKLGIVEVKAPEGYQTPSVDFLHITWESHDLENVKNTGNTKLVPDVNLFGKEYRADDNLVKANFKDADNQPIEVGLKNFKASEAPVGLPLTGGLGIALFLMLGVTVVAITLYVRYRISKAQTSAR
jgi:hypothetical protein